MGGALGGQNPGAPLDAGKSAAQFSCFSYCYAGRGYGSGIAVAQNYRLVTAMHRYGESSVNLEANRQLNKAG